MKKATDNWLKIADKDLKYAKLCLDAQEPLGTITHLHASVEKVMKGLCEELIGTPPKIHRLKKLAVDVCKVNLEKRQIDFITLLDEAFIDSRYPEDIAQFEKEFDIESCKKFYLETKEVIKCLKNLLIKS
jgi:HEPN domain-containing protein